MAEAKKSATVTYLGDGDPSVQSVDMFGRTFVKGEAVSVRVGQKGISERNFEKIVNNPTFSTERDPDLVDAEEPEPADPDEGTELAALRADLDGLGVKYRPNEGVDALRARLAKATAPSE